MVLDPESEDSKSVVRADDVNNEIRALNRIMKDASAYRYTDEEYAAMAAVLARALALVTTQGDQNG